MKFRHCLIILIILNACQSWDESPATDDSVNMEKNDILFFEEENPDQARQRLHLNQGVIKPIVEENYANKSILESRVNSAGDYTIIAQIDNPIHTGNELSATSVAFSDRWDKIYVSYHLNGSQILGSLECYDISDTSNPSWQYGVYSTNMEWNDLHLKTGSSSTQQQTLFAAGNYAEGTSAIAVFQKFPLSSSGGISYSGRSEENRGYGNASSVMKYGDYVFLAKGGEGGNIYPIRKAFDGGYGDWKWESPSGYAIKFMDNYRGNMGVLTNGAIHLINVNQNIATGSSTPEWSKTFDVFSPADGKNVLRMDNSNIYFSAGSSGVYHYTYDTSNAAFQRRVVSNIYSNMACGLDMDSHYVYVANASALTVFKKSEPEILYHYKGFNGGSVNYVKAYKDLLVVAAGTSGVYILDKSGNSTYSSGVNARAAFTPDYVFNGSNHDTAYEDYGSGDVFYDKHGIDKVDFSGSFLTVYFKDAASMSTWRSQTRYAELYSLNRDEDWEQTYRLSSEEEYSVSSAYYYIHYSWTDMGLTSSEASALADDIASAGTGSSILDVIFKSEGASE